ncbi:MAG: RND family transporter [Desulfobacterales bacterium]|nr:MAG: RND family transporter [Desulfobacterales bacterium]
MKTLHALIIPFYDKVILKRPGITILCLLAAVSLLGYQAKDFKLDASAETLILETDEDLQYSRLIKSRYGGHDYLLITYMPKNDLFSDKTLKKIVRLRDELLQLERVSSVVSILDAPLLASPPLPLKEMVSNINTIESPTVDRKLARIEFRTSPLYKNLLVSPDLKTTALQIRFRTDKVYQELLARSDHFREKKTNAPLTESEQAEFNRVNKELQQHRDRRKKIRHQDIAAIRAIMEKHRSDAELFLGGISMVADDLIRFIKSDLKTFGLGVPFFLVIILGIIFKKKRWILLPMICCTFSAISMMGLLGTFGWQVTVISSNFISLQLIITMAITIHLIVRYRELLSQNPETEQRQLILDAVRLKLTPCLYAALTTIAGFGSLLFCNILPVKTFGWMMSAGIIVSLLLTFLIFPTGLILLSKETSKIKSDSQFSLTSFLASFTETHGNMILAISVIVFIISAFGIARLSVENSFINYFKDTTEIHQGMKVIDQNLGGTTPLDVIIEIDMPEISAPVVNAKKNVEKDDAFDEFDEFDEPEDDEKYWFTAAKMELVTKIHDYLDSLPETGKILSLGTMMKIADKLNNGKPLDNFQLAMLHSELPDRFKRMLIKPYVSPQYNQLRFSIRVKDSEKTLKRNALLKKIRHDLTSQFGLKAEHVHLAGLLLLYNNMLQSLFNSQILTLGVVILALMGMFMILFRSLKLALIAITPNLLAIGVVLGVMGWLSIALDMMTITIAAISIGIGVDNTIHYIYRFKHEFNVVGNYIKTIHQCHTSIGYALYYTSLTIIIGFSILALSNFIPSIYFGLLTGLAMFIALIAALTVLPQLLVVFKPFGPEMLKNQIIKP